MLSYCAYGLGISSTLPLPELVTGEARADVAIRLGRVECSPMGASAAGTSFRAAAEEVYLCWEGVGAFAVRGGCEIIVEPAPGVAEGELRLFILGPALAVLLWQRGRLVLHASAVAVDGGAIAFLGESGWGKSTIAAAMQAYGHSFVADDILAVDFQGAGGPMVSPGFPQLKLWPDAVVALGEIPETLPRLHPRSEKRARCVRSEVSQEVLPLRHIYVLAEGPIRAIQPLRPQEALIELVRHSYGVRLLQAVGAPAVSSHFWQCTRLAKDLPIHRLQRPPSLRELPDLAKMVEESLARDIA